MHPMPSFGWKACCTFNIQTICQNSSGKWQWCWNTFETWLVMTFQIPLSVLDVRAHISTLTGQLKVQLNGEIANKITTCSIFWEKLTLNPLYVQLPNFISQFWSSKGNQVMSILHVDMKMPGGIYVQRPSWVTTTFVGYVPSNDSLALQWGVSLKWPLAAGALTLVDSFNLTKTLPGVN